MREARLSLRFMESFEESRRVFSPLLDRFYAGEDFRTPCAPDERLDALDEFIARVDIDAGIFVSEWFIAHCGVAYSARAI